MSVSADGLLSGHAASTVMYLQKSLAGYPGIPDRLKESISYSLMAGGKRLRPALVLESFASCSGNRGGTGAGMALAAAGAMELIHTFSLVHDDLPAMDDDDLRRGRPTNHKVFGEALAILAGDAMTTLAFELLARDGGEMAIRLIRELAFASGPAGMIGGQALDIEGEGKSLVLAELQHLHRLKTGALLRCSCRMGAIAAGADESKIAAVTAFGEHLGLAFQIVDDLLDVTSTPEQMGKATGKDQEKGKNTYPSLLGLEATQRQAKQELGAALESVQSLGAATDGLRKIAEFVVRRTH